MEITLEQHRARLKFFEDSDGKMAYVDEGDKNGRTIVLLHGMPTSSWLYRNIIPGLSSAGFRVIAPDLLGFGASGKPKDHRLYAFERQADRLVRLMTHLGIANWTQVVHDLGGPWTWELADRNPKVLNALIVLNTTAYKKGFSPPSMMKIVGGPMGNMIAFMIKNSVTGPAQVKSLFGQLMKYPKKLSKEALRGYWVPMHEGGTQAFLAFARIFPWWYKQFERYQNALRRLKIPACTIWGGADAVLDVTQLPNQFARDLKIPAQDQHVLDANHFLQEDQPEELTRFIVKFMMQTKEQGA